MKYQYAFILLAVLSSCMYTTEDPNPTKEPETNIDFTFETIANQGIHIQLNSQSGNKLSNVKVQVWDDSPLNGGQIIYKGFTDNLGAISADYNFRTSLDTVILDISYIGLPNYLIVPVEDLNAGVIISGSETIYSSLPDYLTPNHSVSSESNLRASAKQNLNLSSLGTYDNLGVPDYLETRDVITSELLDFVNASLPESLPVPDYHPSYLAEGTETNLNITEEADVWMTFVHEGAGYKNMLGFYTYETGNPPQTIDDIETIHVAFPNASYGGYGGGLRSGDKVNLGRFTSGTSIGFVLLADAWTGKMTDGRHQVFSHKELNPEPTDDLKQHTVLLWDDVNELFLIGFEDLNRYEGSDNDFNDAVIYITSNPVEAISVENVNPIDKPVDADGDGVNDVYDEFPNDSRYAYMYSYPGDSSYGTFAFEDQWPGYGDYDFNDLVVDYKYNQYANATNKMVKLESEFVIKAIGAGFQNGFGVQLDIAPSQIASVTGNDIHGDLFAFNSNGIESGQDRAVLIVSDNVHKSFGDMGFINTDPNMPFLTPDTIRVQTEFQTPVVLSGAGVAPFNPFIVINQTRGREVHLPGYEPTALVDESYFNQGNDYSNPAGGVYYKSKTGLPWGMNLPMSFEYPYEKTDVRDAYIHFKTWANSSGFTFMDWYEPKSGYREMNKIYSKNK